MAVLASEELARDGARGLANRGFPAYVLSSGRGPDRHKVRVGPFGDLSSAREIAATLEAIGYRTEVVTESAVR